MSDIRLVEKKWRVDHIDYSIMKLSKESFDMNFYRFRLRSRRSTITTLLFNSVISVHNGKVLKQIHIVKDMNGRKLGEFVFTKVTGSKIHSNNRSQAKKNKKKASNKKLTLKKGGLKTSKKKIGKLKNLKKRIIKKK